MNYEQSQENNPSLTWVGYGFCFLIFQLLVFIFLSSLSLWILLQNTELFVSWYRFFGNFYGNITGIPRADMKLKVNLNFSLAIVMILGGIPILALKLWEYWDEWFISFQREKYNELPNNQKMTFQVHIPKNYYYPNIKIKILFVYLYHSFGVSNINKNTMYNQGKWFGNFTVDYVIENQILKTFLTFPKKNATQVLETFRIIFPEIRLSPVKDPFVDMPESAKEYDDYKNLSGFAMGHSISSLFSASQIQNFPHNDEKLASGLLEYIREFSVDRKFVLQYNFRFDTRVRYERQTKEFDEFLQKLFDKYAPLLEGSVSDDAFTKLLPANEIQKLNAVFERLKSLWFQCGIKVLGFDNNENRYETDDFLDKALRVFIQMNINVEKKYLTATNQTYYNYSVRSTQPETKYLYDTYYFLPPATEQYLAPFYNLFYFPNENNHRSQQLYRTMLSRDIIAPWDGNTFLMDLESVSSSFQLPTM